MKILILALLCSATQAFAYADKTYECLNSDNLPKNTYKIQSVTIAPGTTVPYVEIHRYYRAVAGDQNSAVKESQIRGYATVIQTEPGYELLQVAALRMEFQGDTLLFCRE